MDAGSIVAGLKAHAVIAKTGLAGAVQLTALRGADDVVAPLVAGRLDEVLASLGVLAGRDAQTLIGPGVNVATEAAQALGPLARGAHAGTVPAAAGFESALRSVGQLAERIAALG